MNDKSSQQLNSDSFLETLMTHDHDVSDHIYEGSASPCRENDSVLFGDNLVESKAKLQCNGEQQKEEEEIKVDSKTTNFSSNKHADNPSRG